MASNLNLPNTITMVRIGLVPVFIALLFLSPEKQSWQRWLAVVFFVLANETW